MIKLTGAGEKSKQAYRLMRLDGSEQQLSLWRMQWFPPENGKDTLLCFGSLNVGGSLLLAANTIFYGSYPSTFVNLVWAAIAIFTIATRKRVSSR